MSRTHAQIVTELQARWPEHRVAPSQARVQALCDLLGSPERACPVILIAGTNGKGSTALMIDSLLRSLGLRVGRYASPHLVDLTERISIDGEPISDERFDELFEQVEPLVAMVDEQSARRRPDDVLRGDDRAGLRGVRRRPGRRRGRRGGPRRSLGRHQHRGRPGRGRRAPSTSTTPTCWAPRSRRSRGRRPASSSPARRLFSPPSSQTQPACCSPAARRSVPR
ncbi:MAG: hypothetical protein QM736_22005 [Vicinamibacterales bacterium]